MKILHTTARYFPDPEKTGGLQTHIDEISRAMKASGHVVSVAASIDLPDQQNYYHNGISIHRYSTYPEPPREPNHGALKHAGFKKYQEWFKSQEIDVYHQHQWTPKCGYHHLKLARDRGIPTITSIHVPLPLCRRGTLMEQGIHQCNGYVSLDKCSRCLGIDPNISKYAPLIPARITNALVQENLVNYSFTKSLAIGGYIQQTASALNILSALSDSIVVAADWLRDSLVLNGVPKEKISLNRYGIAKYHQRSLSKKESKDSKQSITVGFFGRWTEIKGPHVLLSALERLPHDCPINLILHGISQDGEYEKSIQTRALKNARVTIGETIALEDMSNYIAKNIDIVAIPSQWLETGPLMVLHSFAAGKPVVGSNLGGIAELITNGCNGKLLPHDKVEEWSEFFQEICQNKEILNIYKHNIKPVRTAEDQARDLLNLYSGLL